MERAVLLVKAEGTARTSTSLSVMAFFEIIGDLDILRKDHAGKFRLMLPFRPEHFHLILHDGPDRYLMSVFIDTEAPGPFPSFLHRSHQFLPLHLPTSHEWS